jgi:hypothetical protein
VQFETLSRKVPEIIHKVSICYIKYGMLQSSLNNIGEERKKKKERNITITIVFCKNFCKNLIIIL